MAGTFGPGLQLFTSPQQPPGTAWVLAPWGQGGRSPAASASNPERPPAATHAPLSTHRQVSKAQTHILLQQPAYLAKATARVAKL